MSNRRASSAPIDITLQMIGAKWRISIINVLLKKDLRFNELKNKIGCTAKVLIKCLKDMENDGLLVRNVDNEKNITEYCLTDIGYTLKPVIDEMLKWGKDYKKYKQLIDKVNR